MAKKGSNANKKRQREAYKAAGRYMVNKRRKLERHLKAYPNDEQAKEALKNIAEYRRKKPYRRGGWYRGNGYPDKWMAEMERKVRVA